MLVKIEEKIKEHEDLSWARSQSSAREKHHGEQHTVSWAQFHTDLAFVVNRLLKKKDEIVLQTSKGSHILFTEPSEMLKRFSVHRQASGLEARNS